MSFMSELNKTLGNEFNYSHTENGALGYRTTQHGILDMNFKVASYRSMDESQIVNDFMKSFFEDKVLAVKWLFYARDARQGLGERRLFRAIMKELANSQTEMVKKLIPIISEYGRYDDLTALIGTKVHYEVISLIKSTLEEDMKNMRDGKSISLMAKWLPSENTSSSETKKMAGQIIKDLKISPKRYRKMLSSLRKYIGIVETKMSQNEWNDIDYEAVPSRANLIYNSAFLRHDEERRRSFLGAVDKGEAKINAGVLYPHDIVHKYSAGGWNSRLNSYDEGIEALWKNLPDLVEGNDSTIVVADGSGSMTSSVGNSRVTALEVANALAIYFAERCNGEFKDKYITFSENPQLVNLSKGNSLREKLEIALRHSEVANTNIEAVFKLILSTAVRSGMSQEEIPQNILIISDMEFDSATSSGWRSNFNSPSKRLFETIANMYADKGYKLPRLVFWNVNSRTGTIPVKENELGVALVSGFSTNIAKMVMSNKTDPYEALVETLNSERYAIIGELLSK